MASELADGVVKRLRSIHAMKKGALKMFAPMLATVALERDDPATSAEVSELLGRMHDAFSGHYEETKAQVDRFEARLRALGSAPAGATAAALGLGARGWVKAGSLGGTNHGANARNAFVFEHLEISSLKLLEQLAERAEDAETAALAAACCTEDEAMAATIDRNWTNVLTLSLAGQGTSHS